MNKYNRIFAFSKFLPKNLTIKFLREIHKYDYIRPINYPRREIPKNIIDKNKNALESSRTNQTENKKKEYYTILGLKKDSTFNEIKRAYYVLAKKFHPDSTKGTDSANGAKKFQEISEAYHVLGDENKRMEYDLYGTVKDVGSYLRTITARNSKPKLSSSLSQIIKERNFVTDNNKFDIPQGVHIPDEVDLTLTFLQAVQGAMRDISVKVLSLCKNCGGTLGRQKKTLELCKVCNGTGRYITTTRNFVVKGTCKACKGGRYTSRYECTQCNNSGYITSHSKMPVKVPPGASSGDILKVPHPDGKQMINIRIKVIKNKYFTRIGNDIITEKYLTITQAILGGTFKIRGIYEELVVKLPEGVESHTKVRLAGKGVHTKGGVGDHIVLFKIKIPKNLTPKQREALMALAKIESPIRDVDVMSNPYI